MYNSISEGDTSTEEERQTTEGGTFKEEHPTTEDPSLEGMVR